MAGLPPNIAFDWPGATSPVAALALVLFAASTNRAAAPAPAPEAPQSAACDWSSLELIPLAVGKSEVPVPCL